MYEINIYIYNGRQRDPEGWWSCGGRAIFVHMFPLQMITHNCVLRAHQPLFYLLLRLLGANAPPCTHPNPSPHSWVPPYPFMPARTYISFLGKFPGHSWSVIIPCYPISVSFCVVCLCVSDSTPHRTHTNPHTSTTTIRKHPWPPWPHTPCFVHFALCVLGEQIVLARSFSLFACLFWGFS